MSLAQDHITDQAIAYHRYLPNLWYYRFSPGTLPTNAHEAMCREMQDGNPRAHGRWVGGAASVHRKAPCVHEPIIAHFVKLDDTKV